ncbi:MAG: hypothetical protein QHJ82_02425 [Verrucomicrobiota bacterium]|nr:hypothetical protein [Verrucomicrobiota bacterium]
MSGLAQRAIGTGRGGHSQCGVGRTDNCNFARTLPFPPLSSGKFASMTEGKIRFHFLAEAAFQVGWLVWKKKPVEALWQQASVDVFLRAVLGLHKQSEFKNSCVEDAHQRNVWVLALSKLMRPAQIRFKPPCHCPENIQIGRKPVLSGLDSSLQFLFSELVLAVSCRA